MQIRVKLMGVLRSKAPPQGVLDISEGSGIDAVLALLGVPQESVQAFTVNGRLERDRVRPLAAGDELVVLPPVGGG